MINKKLFLFLMLSIFLVSIISAQASYCCERLDNNGPWCQNAPEEECDENYRSVPTSCEATSYCRLGVCINTKEGTCMPNTPERVCTEKGGVWDEKDKADIPQCQLGCCLIGEQAAFVTLTRCKSLASDYGLEINYRMDIQSETECIANARPKVKGACVYEKEYQRTCKFTTRKECQEMGMIGEEANAEFHENYLCSAESLETICGPRGGTTCVEGRDEVYALDTCGNLANVYEASQWGESDSDEGYWGKIIASTCTLNLNVASANQNSKEKCGNCDYFLGSTCKKAERLNKPEYGDFICKDLSCEYEGEDYQHGETWCAETDGVSIIDLSGGRKITTDSSTENLPGSRYFRMVCYNNEVSVEPCADFRQEVCIQSSIGENPPFKTAACRVNMWQDCSSQDNEKDCENSDKRDCKWIGGVSILKDSEGNSLVIDLDEEGESIEASCVPLYAPGYNFWEEGTDATATCSQASTTCFVEYEAGIGELIFGGGKGEVSGDWKCIEKCRAKCIFDDPLGICKAGCKGECPSPCVKKDGTIKQSWKDDMNAICMTMGDCGSSVNYIGKPGYYEDADDFITRSGGEEEEEE